MHLGHLVRGSQGCEGVCALVDDISWAQGTRGLLWVQALLSAT